PLLHYCATRHVLCTLFHTLYFIATASPHTYTLSLHDALPISSSRYVVETTCPVFFLRTPRRSVEPMSKKQVTGTAEYITMIYRRSEEHTSELQSRFDLVCRLLLEK